MDATTPPSDPPDPTTGGAGVSHQDSDPPTDPRDIIRPPNDSDPDINETSTISEMILYGRHALTEYGKITRAGYLWRRRAWKALWLLRLKPRATRQKGDFADLAESLGYSRSQGYKLAHLWGIIEQVDAWCQVKDDQSRMRRAGVEEWPADEAVLKEFPSPDAKTPRAPEERAEQKREEEAARKRAEQHRNSEDDDDDGALAERVAALESQLAAAAARAVTLERQLARERELTEALHSERGVAPATPQAPPRVLTQDSRYSRNSELIASLFDADPEQPPPSGPPKPNPPPPPNIKPDPATIALSADAIAPEQRDDVERNYKLATAWVGKAAPSDIRLRNIRAHSYLSWGEFLTLEQRSTAPKLPKKTWRESRTVADVLTRIDTLIAQPGTAETETEAETPEPEPELEPEPETPAPTSGTMPCQGPYQNSPKAG
jgi:hypothetical protein